VSVSVSVSMSVVVNDTSSINSIACACTCVCVCVRACVSVGVSLTYTSSERCKVEQYSQFPRRSDSKWLSECNTKSKSESRNYRRELMLFIGKPRGRSKMISNKTIVLCLSSEFQKERDLKR